MEGIVEHWEEKQEMKVSKYWYLTRVYACVLCGAENRSRERVYGPKPEDPNERLIWNDTACPQHFF